MRRRADAGELPCFRRGSGPRYFRARDLAAWREADPGARRRRLDRHSTTGPDSLREGLYDLILRLSPAVDLRETVDLLASGLRELVDAADCDIWMPEGERLRCVVCCDVQGFDRTAAGRILPLRTLSADAAQPRVGAAARGRQPRRRPASPRPSATPCAAGASRACSTSPWCSAATSWGSIELYDIVPRDFSGLSAALRSSGHILAGAFAKAALLDRLEQSNRELRRQNRRLSSLLDSGRAITSTLVVEDVLDTLARKSAEAVGAPEC